MPRPFAGGPLVIATHNKGKAKEIGELLQGRIERCVTAGELNLPEPEETETTYTGNAVLKARAAAKASGLPALADDSGFSVRALNGDPGVYSARWAGPEKDFNLAMRKVWEAMDGAEDRAAAFICVLALAWPDGHVESFEGRVDGQVVWPPRGDRGFGYDRIFVPTGGSRTFAELDPAEKHEISHRAQAFRKLVAGCF